MQDESQSRAAETIRQMDALLAEVDERMSQTQALFDKAGIRPEDAARYLQSHRVSPSEREKAQRELDEFKQEIESDARRALELAKSQTSASRVRMAPGRVRI